MHVTLGGGGAIGAGLARELARAGVPLRIVSRTPEKVNSSDELMAADLTDKDAVDRAVAGAEIAYLVAGLPYKIKVWQTGWPAIMQNVIATCKKHGAKLIFFDNIYMYDRQSLAHLTEETAVNPPSKKGAVRAAIARQLLDEAASGGLTAMIVRAADFYGPGIANSVLQETVFNNLKRGKAATWLGRQDRIHSFTYTPDATKAMVLLANEPDAYNQVWHLPTSPEKLTGKDFINLFAEAMQVKAKAMTVPKPMLQLLGLFNPLMKELGEMLYQQTDDYFFASIKFMKRFPGFTVTSYRQGIANVVAAG